MRSLPAFHISVFLSFAIIFFAQEVSALNPWETDFGLQSDVPMPASLGSDGQGATTQDPIFLLNGSVTEAATDLTFPSPLMQPWQHRRTYDSGMTSGVAGQDLLGSHGHSWLGGKQAAVLTQSGADISLVQSASNIRVFKSPSSGNTAIAPPDFNATLFKASPVPVRGNPSDGDIVLTMNDTDEVFIYYGFHGSIPPNRRGKLKERTNLQLRASGHPGELYSYDARGFVTTVTTAYPQQYCISYTYPTNGNDADRLTKIEVYTGMPGASGTVKFAEAEYLYWESLANTHNDVGTFGDLVQVKVSTLNTDRTSWQTRVTQYRYHRDGASSPDGSKDGRNHQIKAVFEPDAIERILAANSSVSTPEALLQKSDTESLASGNSVFSYASRAFAYYTANLTTTGSITTAWGTENLSAKYGGLEQAELKPLVDSSGNPVSGYFVPRVKTETINADCFSCGSGSTGGLKKTYYYMQLHPAPDNYSDGNPNAVANIVVEDTVDSGGTPVLRTIYGLDYRGKELRRVDIENPMAATPNAVAQSSVYNDKGKLVEWRPQDAHIVLDTNTKIAQFLNPYNPGTNSWANDTNTLQASKGVITVFEYDANGNRTGTKQKVGRTGTAYYVSAADYNAKDQVTAEYIYPTQTTSRTASDRVSTTYAYTYWDQDQKVMGATLNLRKPSDLGENWY